MAEADRRSLDIGRGLAGSVGLAIATLVLFVTLTGGFLAWRWAVDGTSEFDRKYDLGMAQTLLIPPAVGCSIVIGCAGWATFAPVRRRRFAPTLAFVFLGTLPFWFLAASVRPGFPLYESKSHPHYFLWGDLLFLVPPVLVAGVLTVRRVQAPVVNLV